jgi:hypothetical protein
MSDDAKSLTTAEVEGWLYALGQHWAARIGPLEHEVVIESDRILATTRALETAQTALTIATSRAAEEDARSDRLQRELDDALHTFRCVEETEQFRAMEARAEKAGKERDLTKSFVAELVRERDTARTERDAARANYENIHQQATSLALLADESVDGRDAALALVAELVTALAGLERRFADPAPNEPGGPCWCAHIHYAALFGHEDSCDAARSVLAKTKGGTP